MSGRVSVDVDLCIGAGNCCRIAPRTFELNNDEVAVVCDATSVSPEVFEAERACPTGAIRIEAEDRAESSTRESRWDEQ
jgi:ferredoxin